VKAVLINIFWVAFLRVDTLATGVVEGRPPKTNHQAMADRVLRLEEN